MALTKVSGDILDTGIVVAGVTTSTNFKTGTSNLHSSGIEIAGINVLGADTPIGAGVTIYNSGGADFTGVVTATRFVGQADISGGSITATTGTFSGDVSIGGTLTYQDVTNVDSTGIATARVGLDILSGGLNIVGLTTGLHVSGVSTFSNDVILTNSNHVTQVLKAGGSTSDLAIDFKDSSNNLEARIFCASDKSDLRFYTGGANERLRITSAGKVGIGTTNPSSKLTVAAASGDTILELQRSNTNTTGAVGVLNFTALDGHSVANIQVRGDGNDEGGAIQFRTTSAAASNDPYAAPHNGLIAMQIKSDGQTVLDGSASQSVNYPIQINNSAAAGNGSNPDITAIAFASGASTKASIQAAVYGEGWMTFHNNNNSEKLRIDASGHILPGAAGTQNLGSTSKEWGDVFIADSKNIQFGNDQDLTIGFDSSNALIGLQTGNLSIIAYDNNKDVKILSDNGSGGVANYFVADGSTGESLLHHYGSQKFATSTTGITVTGEVAASQDYPNFRPRVDWNFAAVKKLDSRITYYRTGPASYTDEFGKVVLVGDNVPRFDHDIVTRECKGLLIEGARTNLVTNSTLRTDGAEGNITKTRVEGPDGVSDSALQVTFTAGGGAFLRSGAVSCSASTEYTFSIWVKKVSGTVSGTGNFYSYVTGSANGLFNTTGFVNTEGETLSAQPTGVWRRFTQTKTTPSGTSAIDFVLPGYDSNGLVLQYYGLQLEAGGFATSFILTEGSTATRGEDVVLIDGTEFTDFFNPIEGTSVVHAHMPNSSGASGLPAYTFKNSSNGNITLGLSRDNNASPAYHYYNDGSNSGFTRASATGDNMYKGAMSFKTSDFDSYVNGSANTNTTTFTMPTIDNLRIGGIGGANQLGGHVARFMYYPVKLSNNKLITLTS